MRDNSQLVSELGHPQCLHGWSNKITQQKNYYSGTFTPITTPHYVISADSSFDRCDRSDYTRIKSLCTDLSVFNRAISHNSQGIIGDRYK